jgi:hypothetical protein
MPTSKYEDDKVEEICDIIEEILKCLEKLRQTDHSMFGGKLDQYIVGPQGLGKINQSVQMLTDFCERNMTGLKSLGEDCTHRKQRRSKSKSPGATIQNSENDEQIRHVADADCYHNLMTANISTRLKNINVIWGKLYA